MRKVFGLIFLLIFVGVVLTVVGFFMSDGTTLDLFERQDYTLTELSYDADAYADLSMVFINREIEIYPSETDQILINYYEAENDWVDIEIDGASLQLVNHTKWYFGSSWIFSGWGFNHYNKVVIYLPVSVLGYALDISTSNGSIDMTDINGLISADFGSLNGAITLENITLTEELSITTSNGKIMLTNVSSNGAIDLKTSNGDIDVINLTADNLEATTSNGSIEIEIHGAYEEYRIEMDTSNGNMYIDGEKKSDGRYNLTLPDVINLHTSNGSIKLNFIQ